MITTIQFSKGQKFKLLFDKNTYHVLKVIGNSIFVEDENCSIISFYYDAIIRKVKFIKK